MAVRILEGPSFGAPCWWFRMRSKRAQCKRRREEKNSPGYATATLLTVIHNHMQEYFFAKLSRRTTK
jgi:hypothetical protein